MDAHIDNTASIQHMADHSVCVDLATTLDLQLHVLSGINTRMGLAHQNVRQQLGAMADSTILKTVPHRCLLDMQTWLASQESVQVQHDREVDTDSKIPKQAH